MSARGGQDGLTLVEVLLAAALMIVVLMAVLGTADMFGARTRAGAELTADGERSRQAVERITRDLRSASAGGQAAALLRGGPSDLVLVTDAAAEAPGQWRGVRYCWDGADLVRQVSGAGAVTLPATGCPDAAWGTVERIVPATAGPPFTVTGTDPVTVSVALGAGGSPPLRSAVALRNTTLDADAITCEQTGEGTALLGLGVGAAGLLSIPLTFADLLGLRALLFGAEPPPERWECP